MFQEHVYKKILGHNVPHLLNSLATVRLGCQFTRVLLRTGNHEEVKEVRDIAIKKVLKLFQMFNRPQSSIILICPA